MHLRGRHDGGFVTSLSGTRQSNNNNGRTVTSHKYLCRRREAGRNPFSLAFGWSSIIGRQKRDLRGGRDVSYVPVSTSSLVRKPDDVSLGRTRSGSRVYVSYPPPTVVCGSAVAFCCTVRTILLYFLPLAILVTSCTLLLVTILFSRLQLPSRIGNVWNRLGQFWHSLFVRATRYASDKRSTRHVLMSRCGAHGGGGCSGGGLILRYQKAHGAPPLSPVQCAIVLWLFALWSLSQNSSIVWFSTRIF